MVCIKINWKGHCFNLVNIYTPCIEERLGEGGYHNRRGVKEFQEFIERMGVVDIPCVGGKFSWDKDNEKEMSRIDRFLVTINLIDVWDVVDQMIGCRDLSDHAPIRLNYGFIDWGPNPFRFNNVGLNMMS